jgi:hypothetical protein
VSLLLHPPNAQKTFTLFAVVDMDINPENLFNVEKEVMKIKRLMMWTIMSQGLLIFFCALIKWMEKKALVRDVYLSPKEIHFCCCCGNQIFYWFHVDLLMNLDVKYRVFIRATTFEMCRCQDFVIWNLILSLVLFEGNNNDNNGFSIWY